MEAIFRFISSAAIWYAEYLKNAAMDASHLHAIPKIDAQDFVEEFIMFALPQDRRAVFDCMNHIGQHLRSCL